MNRRIARSRGLLLSTFLYGTLSGCGGGAGTPQHSTTNGASTQPVGTNPARGAAGAAAPDPMSAAPAAQAPPGPVNAGTASGSGGAAATPGAPSMPGAAGKPMQPGTTQPSGAASDDVTCYEFAMHGQQAPGDSSPFPLAAGENFDCFYYKVPWTENTLSVQFSGTLDHPEMTHHWFLYAMPTAHDDGSFETCYSVHVDGPTLLAGWSPGGADVVLPQDVGVENPAPGTTLMVEWHHLNTTDAAVMDQSKVEVCTVPADHRPHVAALSWLGTEDLNGIVGMPPGVQSSFSGTCDPLRTGLAAGDAIHVLYAMPHMHQYGRTMKTLINRAAGGQDVLIDAMFDDTRQIWHDAKADILAGDTLTTTCTYDNTSGAAVPFGGPFTGGEMCYNFVLAYPAHALESNATSLLGATNTCL